MASTNLSSISSGSARPITQEQNRVVAAMQILFVLMGIILILIGNIRISFESDAIFDIYTKPIGTYFLDHPDHPILKLIFSALDNSSDENEDANTTTTQVSNTSSSGASGLRLVGFFNSVTFLVISLVMAIGGFGLIWCAVALGAKEPPAWHAGRNGLVALISVMILAIVGVVVGRPNYLKYVAPPAIVIIIVTGWLLSQFAQADYRLALGAERLQREQNRNRVLLRNATVVIGVSTLLVLTLVHAILTDAIELPLGDVEPNEFIFMTTFDNYNDEWDTFNDGRNVAEMETDENGNTYFVLTVTPEESHGNPTFALLNRKVRDFDVRVTTTQLESDEKYDNHFGVIFRYRSLNEYYRFGISGDGWYILEKIEPNPDNPDESQITTISVWIPTTDTTAATVPPYPTLIRPGTENPVESLADTMNEIRVVGRGDQFWFYVNGESVPLCLKGSRGNSMWVGNKGKCVAGNTPTFVFEDDDFEQGQIGFFADRTPSTSYADPQTQTHFPISIAFDNVVIDGPPDDVPFDTFPSLPATTVPIEVPDIEIPDVE